MWIYQRVTPQKDGTSLIEPYFNRIFEWTLLFYLLERIALAALYHPEMMRMDQHQKRYGWELKIYKSQEFWWEKGPQVAISSLAKMESPKSPGAVDGGSASLKIKQGHDDCTTRKTQREVTACLHMFTVHSGELT